MTKLCFLDTETTSLRPDRRAWEVGLITRSPDGTRDDEHHWFVRAEDLDLGNADQMALKVGRFYERHPQILPGNWQTSLVSGEIEVLRQVEKMTRGAHVVGAVPNFDTEVLASRMRANGICPSWHYHLIDVEALAVGYCAKAAQVLAQSEPGTAPEFRRILHAPWKSDDLSAALGITVSEEDRHTALGDARWARAIYDAVMVVAP